MIQLAHIGPASSPGHLGSVLLVPRLIVGFCNAGMRLLEGADGRPQTASLRNLFRKIGPMKLIKIKFTAWRDQREASRSLEFQKQLDEWAGHERVLNGAAVRVRQQQATADSEVLKMQIAAITKEINNIHASRQPLLDAETSTIKRAEAALLRHKKVGTFGYQVLNSAGTEMIKIVDESGRDLPAEAVYAFEVVDTYPSRPAWAKKRKFGH